jgi:transcriptional regulator with XRE-family HTH domain
VNEFDLVGALRRIRRRADMSQRELARACGVSQSAVARVEAGQSGISVGFLARAAGIAGLRIGLLDEGGREAPGMTDAGARDRGYRRLPAHLDTVHSEQRADRYQHRPSRPQPTYTVDRDRSYRDWVRAQDGTPEDHHVEQPGDSPAERAAARREAARRRADEAHQRWLESGGARRVEPGWVCTCPPLCDELDDRNGKPVHADACLCGCDVA